MRPEEIEDEFTYAQVRALAGAKRKQIVAELLARGVNPDYAETVVNGALDKLPGRGPSRFGWIELGAGGILLILGCGLFYARAALLFDGAVTGFRLPTGILIVGGLLLARGLFR